MGLHLLFGLLSAYKKEFLASMNMIPEYPMNKKEKEWIPMNKEEWKQFCCKNCKVKMSKE